MAATTQKTQATQVTDMLREDHRYVKKLFEQFAKTKNAQKKRQIVETALTGLQIHAELEEKLIYPAVRPKLKDEDLMDEALEEHHVVHVIIGELKNMKPGDERYDAKFTVLGELCKHHIKEEEAEMLPMAEKRAIAWESLHEQVVKRKEQLLRKAGKSSNNNGTRQHSTKRKKK